MVKSYFRSVVFKNTRIEHSKQTIVTIMYLVPVNVSTNKLYHVHVPQ